MNTDNIEKKTDKLKCISKEKYSKIINNCELHSIDEKYRNSVVHAIKLLFLDIENKKRIKKGDNIILVEIIKNDVEKLNFFVIEHKIKKFKDASREMKIKNTIVYLESCIYNSIHKMDLDIDSELRYQGLI